MEMNLLILQELAGMTAFINVVLTIATLVGLPSIVRLLINASIGLMIVSKAQNWSNEHAGIHKRLRLVGLLGTSVMAAYDLGLCWQRMSL